MPDKVYWIGDDGDNKSVCIKRALYVKGDEIPADGVLQEQLDEWQKSGLIAVGDSAAPVVIIDTDAVKNLKIEIVSLKRDLERIPGLEREITDLKKAAEKAKGGTKAKVVKDLKAEAKVKDDRIKSLEDEIAVLDTDIIKGLKASVTALDLDNQEKAALIDKLKSDLEGAAKPDDSGAGPGGSE